MILSPTRCLQAVLAGAVSANQPEFVISYDTYNTDGKLALPSHTEGVLNGNTDVTLLAAPTVQGTRFEILSASIYNKDTASITLTVKTDTAAGGGTEYIVHKVVLLTLESLKYQKGRGWYALDANGNIKESLSAASNWAVSGNLTVAGNTTLGDAAADSLTINAGTLSMPNIPAFSAASAGASNATGDTTDATVTFGTEIFDQGSNFASNTFTAPTTGRYQLSAYVQVTGLDASVTRILVQINTSNRNYEISRDNDPRDGTNIVTTGGSILADMDAADTATVHLSVYGTTKTVGYGTDTRFTGIQIA